MPQAFIAAFLLLPLTAMAQAAEPRFNLVTLSAQAETFPVITVSGTVQLQ